MFSRTIRKKSQATVAKKIKDIYQTVSSYLATAVEVLTSTLKTSPGKLPAKPLQFLPIVNGTARYLALMDGGSELNMISEELLPELRNYKPKELPLTRVFGAFSGAEEPSPWIDMEIILPNGKRITVPFAVVKNRKNMIVLGMEFFHEYKAAQDYAIATLRTKLGTFALVERRPFRLHACTAEIKEEQPTEDLQQLIPLLDTSLTDEQKEECRQVLWEYRDLWQGDPRGKVKGVSHHIRLTSRKPIVHRPRVVTEEQKLCIKQELDKMLEEGVVRPSDSPYAQEVVMVLKKTKDWRFCADYRDLNKVTVVDKYPLPRISDLIRAVHGSAHFVALDLRAGYWQVPMEPSSIKYTAFRCFLGLYEFLVMPFGLTNAPATFQRLMDLLLGDLRFAGVLCYMDDILVHSPTFEGTLNRLRRVLSRLRAANITINMPKSSFFPTELRYLGQMIRNGQLTPDPKKLETLKKIKTPATVHDVRSMLGFFGYYQAYIPNYAIIMEPLYRLLRQQKNCKKANAVTRIQWTEEHQEAIEKARNLLLDATLVMPDASDTYLIETDASGTAVAAILNVKQGEEWRPVEYYSKTLNKVQRNWPTREREAYAIIIGLQKFDCYVRGRPTTIVTDHQSLQWLMDAQKGKLARWASLLSEYPLTILHRRGTELVHVDYLTRHIEEPEEMVQDRMCYYTSTSSIPSLQDILEAQAATDIPVGKGFIMKEKTTYYHGLIWVPPALRTTIIAACHSVAPFHHPGIKKTRRLIQRTFNWPGLQTDVVKYLQSCLHCRRARSGKERLQGLQRAHPVPLAFELVYMDLWQVKYDEQHYHVLTMIDQATKWVECATVSDLSAPTIASAFMTQWIYRFGAPRRLVTDNGKSFCNAFMDRLMARIGVTRLTTTPYHPEGNAVIESFHRTLNQGFRHLNHKALPFQEALGMILFGYRVNIHVTTGNSPAFLTYGQDPQLVPDQDWRMEITLSTQERLKYLAALRLEVQLKAYQTALRDVTLKNKERQPTEFELFQLVLCHLHPTERVKYKVAYYKAIPRWTLPHRVVRVLPSKQSALVKCLITGDIRQVHIQDVRFVLPPDGPIQEEEWRSILQEEVLTMYDQETAARVMNLFFEELQEPQRGVPEEDSDKIRPTRKRRRVTPEV